MEINTKNGNMRATLEKYLNLIVIKRIFRYL